MQCPYCGYSDSHVIDTRDAGDGIRRRRECLQCGLRYTTYERVQTTALMVLKRDTRKEEYNHQKLLNSIRVACAKRPLPTGAIERIVADVEEQLQGLGRADIPSLSHRRDGDGTPEKTRQSGVYPLRQCLSRLRGSGDVPGRGGRHALVSGNRAGAGEPGHIVSTGRRQAEATAPGQAAQTAKRRQAG